MDMKSLLITAVCVVMSYGAGQAIAGDQAKVTREDAERIALTRVPGGMIKEGELETEHGKLVWSFEIAQRTSPDVIEVQVDAMTGEVVAMETETGDDDAKEPAEDDKQRK
jgi:uncharacterized membrane protein YkoI